MSATTAAAVAPDPVRDRRRGGHRVAQFATPASNRLDGIRGIGGRPGSPEWFGAVGWATAFLVTFAAPALQLAGVLAPLPVLDTLWIHTLGIILAVTGITATMHAQLAMGDSRRIGVDPGETTTLVRTGVFGVVRNPIYFAMLVF
jgi:hypothetical protein